MKKGFDRLKGVAAASVMGLGMIGAAGSGRAAPLPTNSRSLGFSIRTTLAATISGQDLNATVMGIGGKSSGDTFDIGAFRVVNTGKPLINTFPTSYTTSYVSVSGSWTTTETFTGVTSFAVGPGVELSCPNGTASSFPTTEPTSGACWLTTDTFTLTNGYYASISSTDIWVSEFTTGSSDTVGRSAYNDAFDGVLGMTVDGVVFMNPDNTVDFTDDVVNSDVVNFTGGGTSNIDAQIQYAFAADRGDTSVGAVRAMYTLTNNEGSEKTITVNIFGNLGSNEYTTIQASASGDTVADDADQWTVSSETQAGNETQMGWTPPLLITRYGTGAAVVPAQTSVLGERDATWTNVGNDVFANDYELTIPAGETQRILVFIEAHKTNAGAEAAGADFETMAAARKAGALSGLTEDELKEVVNYEYAAPAPASSDDDDGFLGIGASGAPALLALLGIPALLRRFRKGK